MNRKRYTVLLTIMLLLVFVGQALAERDTVVGKVSAQDWIDRLPVLIATTIFVIVVDAVFVIPAIRKLRTLKRAQGR
ncbi:MAG TPA: hypothetical protein VKY59_04955 [Spirillospora sp.]|nr:hypothetical protein [Spirillospora sp.]